MISPEEVKHIAKLSRLALTKDELDAIEKDLSRILEYVETLNKVDTEDAAPLNGGTDLVNEFREDVVTKEQARLSTEETVANLLLTAPAKEKGYVKVKSIF